MISVEEARERILSYCAVLPSEERPMLDALGQVIAEDIVSEHRHPAARQHGDGRLRGARGRHRGRDRSRAR